MAEANPVKDICEAVICSICLDYFRDPLILRCGHNFCRSCISQCKDKLCPQCRKPFQEEEYQPNRQLGNVAEIAKKFPDSTGTRVCGKHEELLKLFCEVDQTPICVVCRESRSHKEHSVVPVEEAAQDCKDQIQSLLESLKKERVTILSFKLSGENESQKLQKELETEKQKIVSEFHQLQQFLKKQEQLLLDKLEELSKEIEKRRDEYVAKLSEELSSFRDLINEIELKYQLPTSELLQDIKDILNRCKRKMSWKPVAFSFERKWKIRVLSQNSALLGTEVKKFKETLQWELEPGKEIVTLDPETAHHQLVLFDNGKSVRWANMWQTLPNNPERFDTERCVLGREGFTSGRHCWEVEVGDGRRWAVGVARESVRRKGRINPSPEEGIWAVGWWRDRFLAFGSFVNPLPLSRVPSRIRVCLDCDRGQVTFLDADDKAQIFAFPPGSVHGGRIRPWFGVYGSQLRLSLSAGGRGNSILGIIGLSSLTHPGLCDPGGLPATQPSGPSSL